MMRLFLVEKSGDRKIDLGLFRFNDEAQCIKAAERKHGFLSRMQTNGFEFKGEIEAGPLRIPRKDVPQCEQLTIPA